MLTGDRHLAEDLVQETLGKLYRSWKRVAEVQSQAAYANAVLTRTYLSHRRLRRNGERPSAWLADHAAPSPDTDLRLTLLDSLALLTPKDRAVLVLRYWEDWSVEETAEALHLSATAVRSQSRRAVQRLRTVLGDQIFDLAGQ
jgi:RNA polymerase sigma factor (sigma-70 family)